MARFRGGLYLRGADLSKRYSQAFNACTMEFLFLMALESSQASNHPVEAGKIGREQLEGTYTLDADCTGTMTFGGIINPSSNVHWDLYVTEDHKRGHLIRMDEGNMAVRSFEK